MKAARYIGVGLFLLALGVRLGYGLFQLSQGFLAISEGDYTLYQLGAEHIRAEGNFDNSLFLVRPPLFPLIVALLQDNHTAIIVLNSVFGALLAPLTMLLAFQLSLGQRVAWLAGLLVALDPVTVRYTAFLGPEALSFAGALGMLNALVALHNSDNRRESLVWGVAAAALLLLSAYTRPSIYLIWTGFSVWLLLTRWRYAAAVVVFAALSYGGVALWSAHNAAQFGNRTFSTVGPYTMTYYRAVSVLRFGEGLSTDAAYTEINRRIKTDLGQDPATATPDDRHNYLAATPPVAEALTQTSLDIFVSYPLWYVATLGVGTVRFFYLLPHFPPYEHFLNPLSYLVPAWNAALLLLAGYGVWLAFRRRRWTFLVVTVFFGGYFTVGTLLVKSAGLSGRERTVIFPVIALAAAYALSHVIPYFQNQTGENKTEDV